MAEIQKRQIAYTVPIEDIIQGEFHRMEGWDPNFVKVSWGLRISRVNLVGTVLGIGDNQIDIDDSTGIITVRSFEKFEDFDKLNVGDFVLVVGRVREFSGEIFISPETCTIVDREIIGMRKSEWELVKALFKEGKIVQEEKDVVVEIKEEPKVELVQENLAEKVLSFIEEKDSGDGVNRQEILSHFEDAKVGDVFSKLVSDGDIFEVKTDVFKVLK